MIEGIAHSTAYLYIHSVATESQTEAMNKKLKDKVSKSLKVKNNNNK